jgi:hypothetical protein
MYRDTVAPNIQQQATQALNQAEQTTGVSSSQMTQAVQGIIQDWNQIIQQVLSNLRSMADDMDTIAKNMSQTDEDQSNSVKQLTSQIQSGLGSFLAG